MIFNRERRDIFKNSQVAEKQEIAFIGNGHKNHSMFNDLMDITDESEPTPSIILECQFSLCSKHFIIFLPDFLLELAYTFVFNFA